MRREQWFITVKATKVDLICNILFFACKIDNKEFSLLDIEVSEKDLAIQNKVR